MNMQQAQEMLSAAFQRESLISIPGMVIYPDGAIVLVCTGCEIYLNSDGTWFVSSSEGG